MTNKQIEVTARWLFNDNYAHFGTTRDQAIAALEQFEQFIPGLWRNPDPSFEPLYPPASGLEQLIGLSGLARSGKDTCADRLEEHGYRRDAFARPIKVMCKALMGWTDKHVHGELKEVVDPQWGMSPRTAMQLLGTECVRNLVGTDFWIQSLELRCQGKVVITDVRFPNEADFVLERGELWRIERKDRDAAGNFMHPSETALLDFKRWTHVIPNDWTIDELWHRVDQLV